jgi:mRNA interferase RelE/StbE
LTTDGRWVLTARGRRDFRRLDTPVQRRIADALDRLVADPPQGDITKLAGSDDEYRLRVGDWRVRFIREDDTVYVLRVLPRGRAYRD